MKWQKGTCPNPNGRPVDPLSLCAFRRKNPDISREDFDRELISRMTSGLKEYSVPARNLYLKLHTATCPKWDIVRVLECKGWQLSDALRFTSDLMKEMLERKAARKDIPLKVQFPDRIIRIEKSRPNQNGICKGCRKPAHFVIDGYHGKSVFKSIFTLPPLTVFNGFPAPEEFEIERDEQGLIMHFTKRITK